MCRIWDFSIGREIALTLSSLFHLMSVEASLNLICKSNVLPHFFDQHSGHTLSKTSVCAFGLFSYVWPGGVQGLLLLFFFFQLLSRYCMSGWVLPWSSTSFAKCLYHKKPPRAMPPCFYKNESTDHTGKKLFESFQLEKKLKLPWQRKTEFRTKKG